jgi:hypothetical protein
MEVVNKHKHAPTPSDVYIGRPSVLGNPFTHIKDRHTLAEHVCGTREESIERYRRWLLEQIRSGDADVLDALHALNDDSILVCWCKPEACHGDVIVRAVEWLRRLKHTWYVHDNCNQPGTCMWCDGGLGWCTVCGAFEGQLTTHCPGRKLTEEELEATYAEKLDFVGGLWITKA